jgi:hypothetical protein
MVDDMMTLADDDTLEPNDRRIRLETRRWIVEKWYPRRYGQKVQIGGDPENPVRVLHQNVSLDQLPGPALDALAQFASAYINATDVTPIEASEAPETDAEQ